MLSPRHLHVACAASLCAIAWGCSNPELRCISEACGVVQAQVTDNIVTTRGKVCTLDPGSSTYPYKIIFVIDTSLSNMYSDPEHGRPKALMQAIMENYQKSGVSFALVTFSQGPVDEVPGFTDDLALLQSKLPHADQALQNTNYVDTLSMVQQIITHDVANTDPAVAPYVKYDVQWLSDGNPEDVPAVAGDYNDFVHICTPKTTRQAVQAAVNSLYALPKTLGFFSLKLSTIYLDFPGDQGNTYTSVCVKTGPPEKWATGDVYLQEMLRGGGTYQRLMSADLKFDIKVEPVTHSYEQHSFFLVDYSRVLGKAADGSDVLLPDSDQDGIADEVEKTSTMTNPLVADTSGSGCNDRVIQLYDVDNPGTCVALCTGQKSLPTPADTTDAAAKASDDSDSDALLACVETVLRSSDMKPDSDSDEIPDPVELRFGTRLDQAFRVGEDTDLDGVSDIDEIRLGLDPRLPQADRSFAFTYLPLTQAPSDNPSIACYTFEVQNVQLVETQATATTAAGENNLCLTMVQHLRDSPTTQPVVTRACKSAFFKTVDGVVQKTPVDGMVTFSPEDFEAISCVGGNCSQLAPKSTDSLTTAVGATP